jgi:hypothetical protein
MSRSGFSSHGQVDSDSSGTQSDTDSSTEAESVIEAAALAAAARNAALARISTGMAPDQARDLESGLSFSRNSKPGGAGASNGKKNLNIA